MIEGLCTLSDVLMIIMFLGTGILGLPFVILYKVVLKTATTQFHSWGGGSV